MAAAQKNIRKRAGPRGARNLRRFRKVRRTVNDETSPPVSTGGLRPCLTSCVVHPRSVTDLENVQRKRLLRLLDHRTKLQRTRSELRDRVRSLSRPLETILFLRAPHCQGRRRRILQMDNVAWTTRPQRTHAFPISLSKSSSVMIGTPSVLAFSSLLPASSPAMR